MRVGIRGFFVSAYPATTPRTEHTFSPNNSRAYMARALALAELGRGLTNPNPLVGAVIVRDNHIVGEGHHRWAGSAHAEIVALKSAGSRSHGATMFVNLEPCCHHGRTGPCTQAIVKAGITQVVYAMRDPNPHVNGKGVLELRAHGIRVSAGVLCESAARLNEIYLRRFRGERPFVILKTAQSIDGRIATRDFTSRWISGPLGLSLAHRLRAEVDAVVIGAGAVRHDNPRLTVRRVKGRNPFRIVVSSQGALPRRLRVFSENSDGRTIVAVAESRLEKTASRSSTIWSIPGSRSRVSIPGLLDRAWAEGFRSLLVEGGGQLGTTFLRERLVDKHVVVIAPLLLGQGVDAVGDLGVKTIRQGIHYRNASFTQLGDDVVFTGYPVFS